MTNLEKYKDKIIEELYEKYGCCFAALRLRTRKNNKNTRAICLNSNCKACTKKSVEWLAQEYKENEND